MRLNHRFLVKTGLPSIGRLITRATSSPRQVQSALCLCSPCRISILPALRQAGGLTAAGRVTGVRCAGVAVITVQGSAGQAALGRIAGFVSVAKVTVIAGQGGAGLAAQGRVTGLSAIADIPIVTAEGAG